jgi:hypothetical protein
VQQPAGRALPRVQVRRQRVETGRHAVQPIVELGVGHQLACRAFATVHPAGDALQILGRRRQRIGHGGVVQQLAERPLAAANARDDVVQMARRALHLVVERGIGVEPSERAAAAADLRGDLLGGGEEAFELAVDRFVGHQLSDRATPAAHVLDQQGGFFQPFGDFRRGFCDRARGRAAANVAVVRDGCAPARRRDVDRCLAQQRHRAERGNRLRRDASAVFVPDLHEHLDTLAGKRHVGNRADLDPRNPHRRARLQAGDVVEDGLHGIALPEEPAFAAEQKDQRRRHHDRDDRDDADLEFRPSQRTRARHGSPFF